MMCSVAIFKGGLWAIEATSGEEAAKLCEADPFACQGLRKSYRPQVWGKAFPDRTVTL